MKLTICRKPKYFTRYLKGVYNDHEFTVCDINGDVSIMFKEFLPVDNAEYMKIIETVKTRYNATQDK